MPAAARLEQATDRTPQQDEELRQLRRELAERTRQVYANLTPWQIVQVARHKDRPYTSDYLALVFEEFVELHGDRRFGDDRAILTGFARLDRHKVLVVGHQKGRTYKERSACYFGCAHPEGYRKAILKMKLAEKYGLPVICLIDTPGAYPGIGAEERGQSQAIAENMYEMSRLQDADHLRRDRRRGQRRGAGHRRRRPRGHARVLLLLRHQPRRLRRHPLEEPPVRRAGRQRPQVHVGRTCCGWGSSITSSQSRWAAPIATTIRRPCGSSNI